MDLLTSYLQQETPPITRFLDKKLAELDPLIQPVVRHVLHAGGKRLRSVLTLLTGQALGAEEDLYPLACSLEFLHSATLLHDDIVDDADLRRGKPSAHVTFGRSRTILAGDVLLALANLLVADYGRPDLTALFSRAIMQTATGEVQEISSVRTASLTREQYYTIITGKTACLFQSACESAACLATARPDYIRAARKYGLNLGIAFQLIDDALDYDSPAAVSGKPAGGDLREGKLTLPLLLYLESLERSERNTLSTQFEQAAFTEDDIEHTLAAVRASGCTEQTRQEATFYTDKAVKALEQFPECSQKKILYAIAETVLSRQK